MTIQRALSWVLAIAIASAGTAAAQRDGDGARSAIERARQHMERGQALYLQARFEEAATEFEAAYAAQPFSAFLYNAGVALERAGQAERAAEYFERYLASDPSAADRAAVRARVTELRAALAARAQTATEAPATTESTTAATTETQTDGTAPAPDAQTTEAQTTAAPSADAPAEALPDGLPEDFKSLLSVRTNPEGATVTVRREGEGGESVAEGPAPFAQTLDQGRYVLSVAHPDFQTVEQEVRIEPGKVYVVIVEMSQGQFLGYLRVVSDVPGAEVFIDDREQGARGRTPFEGPIPTGAHRVWVERPGYEIAEAEAEVGVGDDITLRVELTRVDYGRLRVIGNIRGARVLVDGVQQGTVPFEGQVSAGPHRLRVEADGMKAYEAALDIQRGQLTPVRARLRPDVDRGGAYVTAVFSALFLGGGVALAVIGNDMMSTLQLERDAGRLAADDPRLDEGLFVYIAADAAFGLSLIFGALALYYFLNDPLPPSEGRVLEARDWAVLPILDPVSGTAGLGVGGSF